MSAGPWIRVADQLPPEEFLVDTKIDDQHGPRQEEQLRRVGEWWWVRNCTRQVFYTPTHWRRPDDTMNPPQENVARWGCDELATIRPGSFLWRD